MEIKILALILIFFANFRICQSKRYDGYSLYSVTPMNVDHLKFLQNVERQKYIDVIFWKSPYKLFTDVQFLVNPSDKDLFLERAGHFRLEAKLLLNDIQQAFEHQNVRQYHRLRVETFTWQNYHTLADVYQWLADIALKYPAQIDLTSIGKSAEGRDIFVVGLKTSGAKPVVIVEGGIHGDEWIATEFVTYLIYQLVYNKNSRLQDLVARYHWYLIPIVNPDGFEYSHNVDRLWRKNRRILGNGHGVDLNRNFDYSFGKHGISSDPNDDHYCGPTSFSEPETKALTEFITMKGDNLKFYFSFHAYGQKIIIPFSDRINHVDNYREMENYGKQAILKMYKLYGVKYSVGTTYDTLGLRISGNSASWVKKNLKVKYVFTFLLRDNGSYGHALPPEQILPTCEETLEGLVEIMTAKPRRVKTLFGAASVPRTSVLLIIVCLLMK
ncbi:hypothetical protein O3G_MSEX008838 [Manduca sexta]|uniref:Peptidase M14 domain-containing protein n=1 Tax=Manduca sexta TaxID=7130 RepID=A0A921ZC01_MANSE|nr:hypothetical protein O3G_MSEX008838 [Manduca sexta]